MKNKNKQMFNNTLSECLTAYWTNYVGWGRATRSEYWWSVLFYGLLGSFVANSLGLDSLWFLATIVPGFCLTARRLHDINCSNWIICWVFFPIIGWTILFVCFCQEGDFTNNKYGAPRI